MSRFVGVLLLGLVLSAAAHGKEPQAGLGDVVSLSMGDQFGKTHDLARLRGDVVVLVFADRPGAENSRALGARLHVLFHPSAEGLPPDEAARAPVRPIPDWPAGARVPDVRLVPSACIGEVPRVLHSYVRGRFKEASPDAPILLDLTDVLRQQFGVTPGVPNVVVLDVEGRLRHKRAGAMDEAQLVSLAQVIESLRVEARPK